MVHQSSGSSGKLTVQRTDVLVRNVATLRVGGGGGRGRSRRRLLVEEGVERPYTITSIIIYPVYTRYQASRVRIVELSTGS
jgi:hypothetical protein